MVSHEAESNSPEIPLILKTAFNQITVTTNSPTCKTLKDLSKDKNGSTLPRGGHVPIHLEHSEATAHFRLMPGRDYRQAFFYPIGLAPDEICLVTLDLQYGQRSL
ncbi:hypothetical protein NPIL_649431 [Nephila pilipes]|uniref:Uncharacterized protein n=1 Tax=Nephila pilipes TaxID=299642 RepID=A0A8X6T9F8_NEPPI|nr:hypothetical protein NPIL_649431 [Nephila pilipes]